MKHLLVSPSPHVGSGWTTKKLMIAVIVALMPSLIASVYFYGAYPLVVTALSVGSAILAEFIYNKLSKQDVTVSDGSAAVTGLILALCLPPVLPLYIPIIGAFFAIIVVKMLFGGIGKNFANPAGTARIFLLLSFSSAMSKYARPVDWSQGFVEGMFSYFNGIGHNIDSITSATPLGGAIPEGNLDGLNLLDMFLGNMGGSIGEVSALAILIGGLFLIVLKVIDWKVPVAVIVSSTLFTLIFYQDVAYILPMLLSGGLLFGAFFMATDYATTPNTDIGRIIFGIGVGFFTVLIRKYGGYPEGASFAILLMNLTTPFIDKYIITRPFGKKREKKPRRAKNV